MELNWSAPGLPKLYQRAKRCNHILRALETHLDANGVHSHEELFDIIQLCKRAAFALTEITQNMQYVGSTEAEQENFNEN